jgi:uncharacterized membrane protein YGL010W
MTMRRFDWVRRMGVHEAYHRSSANRWMHWLCIPIELAGVVKMASLVPLGPIDLAWPAIGLVALVYLATDVVAGVLMLALLAGLHGVVALGTTGSMAGDLLASLILFVVPFVLQTRVGHGVFERGLDDTAMNLAELRRTKDPIPILLVFEYHLVELLFAAGYRPALRSEMEAHRDAEVARLLGGGAPDVGSTRIIP